MAQPVPLGNGIVLTPKSAPTTESDGTLAADYTVSGTPQALRGRIVTRIGAHGVGAAFIAVATTNAFDGVLGTAMSLVQSVQFKQPVIAQTATGNSGGDGGSSRRREHPGPFSRAAWLEIRVSGLSNGGTAPIPRVPPDRRQ